MIQPADEITGIDHDDELGVVVVRTARKTNYEKKLRKKTLTSGCAQGTVFGDMMEKFADITLDPAAVLRTSWIYSLSRQINLTPSLYLAAGAIHGCVLCEAGPADPLYGGRRPPQCDRQDRRLYAPARHGSGGKDLLHHRPPHQRDGDEDGADAHPHPDLALGLHRLGRRAGAARPI